MWFIKNTLRKAQSLETKLTNAALALGMARGLISMRQDWTVEDKEKIDKIDEIVIKTFYAKTKLKK